MKKLFLYGIIFIGVFSFGYFIASYAYKDFKSECITASTTEEVKAPSDKTVGDAIAKAAENRYIVAMEQDDIVVYKNEIGNLYEDSGISSEYVKMIDYDTYMAIKNNISFSSEQEVFAFLESIAN